MNRKLPYENIIAEKMQRLHLPDKEESWQQMKLKLDLELPLSENSKKGSGGKWWLAGSVIIIMLLVSVWGINNIAPEDERVVSGNSNNISSIPNQQSNAANFTSPLFKSADKNNIEKTNTGNTESTINIHDDIDIIDSGNNANNVLKHSKPVPLTLLNQIANSSLIATKGNPQADAGITGNKNAGIKMPAIHINNNQADISPVTKLDAVSGRYSLVSIQNFSYSSQQNIIAFSNKATPGYLAVPDYALTLPDVHVNKKIILRELKRKERKEEKELAKSYRTYKSFWGEPTDRWFAAGIAPYQNFAIAHQQPFNYNSATGKNILTDYIPSPYLQLHVTNRIYLLGEFQFNTPQATPSLLLSQKSLSVPSGNAGYTENIYLRKLYYFNMPVSFYYSPLKNFYLGSGLQFSSFNSGLAYMEQRSANNTLMHTETLKIKDDSLSSKISGSEWRYLFDANYYYDRFMIGFRYNQALNNFVNFRVNNTLPPSQARNQAFQLYIRYNLVISDRKK